MNASVSTPHPDSSESPVEAQITLGVLTAVAENSVVTQRSLSRGLGIALGLTNAYLKRCIRKGLIKVTHAPANRYVYYLTPRGFAEKSRLTARYLSVSFDFFRMARSQCREVFVRCADEGWSQVALYGTGELAEIATLCADSADVQLIGLIDPTGPAVGRLRWVTDLSLLPNLDAVVVTDQRAPQQSYDRLVTQMDRERVLAPDLLHISRVPPKLAE